MEINWIDYLFEDLSKKSDLTSSQGQADFIDIVLPIIFSKPDWFEQDRYLQKLADATEVSIDMLRDIAVSRLGHYTTDAKVRASASLRRDLDALRNEMDALRNRMDSLKGMVGNTKRVESVFAAGYEDPLEKRAIALILQHEDLWDNRFDLKVDFLSHAANRAILSALHAASTMIDAYAELDQQSKKRWTLLSEVQLPPSDKKLRDEDWAACLRRLKERYLRELKSLDRAALEHGSNEDFDSSEYIEYVNRHALEINERLRELFTSND